VCAADVGPRRDEVVPADEPCPASESSPVFSSWGCPARHVGDRNPSCEPLRLSQCDRGRVRACPRCARASSQGRARAERRQCQLANGRGESAPESIPVHLQSSSKSTSTHAVSAACVRNRGGRTGRTRRPNAQLLVLFLFLSSVVALLRSRVVWRSRLGLSCSGGAAAAGHPAFDALTALTELTALSTCHRRSPSRVVLELWRV
jgi:hypothetical protein